MEITEGQAPLFQVLNCPCGAEDCRSILFVMIDPVIVPKGDKLVPAVCFPVDSCQDLIDYIKELAAAKGVMIT